MKKSMLFGFLIIFLVLNTCFVIAIENETALVDKAYDCLEGKVKDKCSKLSSEEKIFSLLAIKECKSEVISDSKNSECWPKPNCKIKTTAQAILALNEINFDTSEAETWLLSQNKSTQEIIWYLQIESSEATICTITYSGSSKTITIGEDKKISSGAGSCLSLVKNDPLLGDKYFLEISIDCYDQEFEISCDKSFLTTLLFKKEDSLTIHVSEKVNSASAQGTTSEKVNSFCFKQGSSCDYEGSLWAALVLDYLGEDVSSYLPYLVAMANENEEYLPESFLYLLTDEFHTDLLSGQRSEGYWSISGDKFYDTALALYALQYESLPEVTSAKEWLLGEGVQGNDGCWQGIRNTAFILYSVWPEQPIEDGDDCDYEGYFCMSSISCNNIDGEVLDYDCGGTFVCCDKKKPLNTCAEKGGEICGSSKTCTGDTISAPDLSYGEICCVDGTCKTPIETSECESYGGTCEAYGCGDDEEEEDSYDCDYGETCCVQKTTSEKNYLWIWLLVLLIFLVVLGIIFKDKLRSYWFRIKSKFGKSRRGPPGRPGPPLFSPPPSRRVRPRRILPPAHRPPARRPHPKPKGEIDSVLKKLKEMGK